MLADEARGAAGVELSPVDGDGDGDGECDGDGERDGDALTDTDAEIVELIIIVLAETVATLKAATKR